MAIIRGGMVGLTTSVSLKRLGIDVVVLNRSPAGFEGPWATTVRMETLCSPEQSTGPTLDLPTLTFRTWFEAQLGTDAWEVLDKVPRLQWMDYLRQYRHVLQLDVHNEHRVKAVHPRMDGTTELLIDAPGQPTQRVFAHRVMLATDWGELGGPSVSDFARRLPRRWWVHSSDEVDYGMLTGKCVGMIDAGASAMDSAATALEAGATSVDMLIHRSDLPRVDKDEEVGSPGFVHGYLYPPDAWKQCTRHYVNVEQAPPPRGSTPRVSRHPNAHFNLGCGILGADEHNGILHVTITKGVLQLGFLIFSTGFYTDWASRLEFSALAPHIRQWRDCYMPRSGEEDAELVDSPDLGRAFKFHEKTSGTLPGLSRTYYFCYPASVVHGSVSGDIPAISEDAKRLAQGIVGLLYQEDIDTHYIAVQAYAEPEISGDKWTPAPPPGVEANATSGQEAAR